jgi:hypothetical protein
MRLLFSVFLYCLISATYSINPPTLISPSNGAINIHIGQILDWSHISGNAGYLFQIDTIATFNSPNLLSGSSSTNSSQVTPTNLRFGTTYYWRAATKSLIDTSVWTSTFSFTTIDNPILVSPNNGATNIPVGQVLDWSHVVGNTGYLYQIDTVSSFSSSLLINGNSSTNSSQTTVNSLRFGTNYFWRVAIKNATDTSMWSNVYSFSTTDAVTLISPSNGATNRPVAQTLDWSSVSGNTGYLYQIDTVPSFNSPLFLDGVTSTNSSQFYVNNLRFGTTYYWRAAAKNTSDTSMWSSTFTFQTTDAVTLSSPSNGATNRPVSQNLDWSSVTGNTGYLYQIDNDPTFNTSNLFTGTTSTNSSLANVNLLFGTIYYWRAAAKNSVDTSNWSSAWKFTTAYQLSAPNLVSPSDGATINPLINTLFDWDTIVNSNAFEIQISTTSTFNSLSIVQFTNSTQGNFGPFSGNTTYYWRVRAKNSFGNSPWSTFRSFATQNCNSAVTINEHSCGLYTSPSGSFQWSNTGIYMDTLSNSGGCDSIITVNLTITNLNNSINQSSNSLTTLQTADHYQWLDCNNNYSVLVNDTLQTYTASANGSYAVEVQKNGCIDTSACLQIIGVGITENKTNDFSFYPNPATSLITINSNKNYQLKLFDLKGKVIIDKHIILERIYNLALSDLENGIYILEVLTESETKRIKLIKN